MSDEQATRNDIFSAFGDSNAQREKLPLIDTVKEAHPERRWQNGDGTVEEGTVQWRQGHWVKLPDAFSVAELDLLLLIVKIAVAAVHHSSFIMHHANTTQASRMPIFCPLS